MCLQVCELLSLSSAGRASTGCGSPQSWPALGAQSQPAFHYQLVVPSTRTQMQTSIKLHYANIRSKVATKAHRAWEEVKDDKWEIGNGFGFGFGFGLGFGIGG